MLKLNHDILSFIFEELSDTGHYLLCCLLVNKFWCKIVVPILWRCPIKYFTDDDFDNEERRKSLLNMIILHLPETSRKLLLNENINIISVERQEQKLSFDYVSFCKYINHKFFFNKDTRLSNDSQQILLEQEIYKLFMNKCSIKYLNPVDMKHPIYKLSGAKTSLSNLFELSCNSCEKEPSFFYELAQICRSIEKIYIEYWNSDNPGLAKLIEMQKQIKYVNINSVYHNWFGSKVTSQALEKHAPSIIYFGLDIESMADGSFMNFLLPKLINLQILRLTANKQIANHLINAPYSKLQILELQGIPICTTTNIIQNTNGNLWKIEAVRPAVGDSFSHDLRESREYIQAIYKYCPNVRYVSLFMNNQSLEELKDLLISCQHLVGIYVEVTGELMFSNSKLEKFDGDKFLDLLVKFAPVSLYKANIDSLKYYTYNTLELFFNNWRGRKPLHFYGYECFFELNFLKKHNMKVTIIGDELWDADIDTQFTWVDYIFRTAY